MHRMTRDNLTWCRAVAAGVHSGHTEVVTALIVALDGYDAALQESDRLRALWDIDLTNLAALRTALAALEDTQCKS